MAVFAKKNEDGTWVVGFTQLEGMLPADCDKTEVLTLSDNKYVIDPNLVASEQIQILKNKQNKAYLEMTDWYAIRKADTGEDYPQLIKDARNAAREAIT